MISRRGRFEMSLGIYLQQGLCLRVSRVFCLNNNDNRTTTPITAITTFPQRCHEAEAPKQSGSSCEEETENSRAVERTSFARVAEEILP